MRCQAKRILAAVSLLSAAALTTAFGFVESDTNRRLLFDQLQALQKTHSGDGVRFSINPASRIVFPQIANGGGAGLRYVTSLSLSNVQSETITVILKIFDRAGDYLAVDLLNSVTGQPLSPLDVGLYHIRVEPFQTAFLETSGVGPLTEGWAKAWAVCENPDSCKEGATYLVGGNAAFKLIRDPGGDLLSIVGVAASSPTPGFCIPVLKDVSKDSKTAFALANNSKTTAYLKVYSMGTDGTVDVTKITLKAGSHMAQFVDELFPGMGSRFYGTLQFFQVDESGNVDVRFDVHPISLLFVGDVMTSVPVTNILPLELPEPEEGWDPGPRARPNLAPYQPAGWSDKIVVSKVKGTHTDSTGLTTEDTLYVDFANHNYGTASTAARFDTELLVDGASHGSWYLEPPLEPGHFSFVEDHSIGSLSAGTHKISMRVDSRGAIAESNEADNEYTKTITVGGKPPGGSFDGTWSGTTGQGRPLKFEVENNHVTTVTREIEVQGIGCTVTLSGGIGLDPGAEIVENTFTWSYSYGDSMILKGTFSSTTTAGGTLKVTTDAPCAGTAETTWTASRQ